MKAIKNALHCLLMSAVFMISDLGANGPNQHGLSRYGTLKYPATFTHFDYVNPQAPKGGEMRFAQMGSFDTLNRTLQGTPPEGILFTTDSLMARALDEPFSLYGLVAESAEMAPDRSWVIFHLRPEARFHDGTPITPEDIIFSYEIQRDKGLPATRTHYSKVQNAEKVGSRSVKFTFKKEADGSVDPERPLIMGLMPLHSKKYWQGKDFSAVTLTPPLGSGPYKIGKFEPGRFIEYERVKDYWAQNLPVRKGLNNFDKLRFEYFKSAPVAMESFKADGFDIINEADLNKWNTLYQGPAFKDGRIIKLVAQHIRPVGIKALVFNTRRPQFQDIRVRRALLTLFDFEWMNKNLFSGGYERTQSYYESSPFKAMGKPVGPELTLLEEFKGTLDPEVFTASVPIPPIYDGSGHNRKAQEEALSLLKQAGWHLKNGRLVEEKTGKPFEFEILLADPSFEKVVMAYARQLKDVGIEVKIRQIDSAQYVERLAEWDFDMIPHWWAGTLVPGAEQTLYWTTKAANTPGTRNYAGIQSPVVDKLVDRLVSAKTQEEMTIAARAVDRVLRFGYYMIPLYFTNTVYIAYWNKFDMPPWNEQIGNLSNAWWAKK